MEDIVIVSAARTAVGKFGGTLAKSPATDLGAAVIKALLARTGLGADQIGEVILGQVLAAGSGQNPARQSLIKSGLAKETPALTINAVCGSGLKAVMLAAQAVAWPWLPEEWVTTPARRSGSVRRRMALVAPRSLKLPVRWRGSGLMRMVPPVASSSARWRSIGVRTMCGVMRARAAWTSSWVGSMDLVLSGGGGA